MFFDTHFHYYREKDLRPEEYCKRAEDVGVTHMLSAGAGYKESQDAAFFASVIEKAWFSAGVHPHEAANFQNDISMFSEFRGNPKLVAVGEIGLDYFYEHSEKKIQQRVFEKFIELSLDWKLPAIIHCRDKEGSDQSYEDAYSILKDFAEDGGSFVVHCFTGKTAWADKLMELGAYIGITGIVTFPKAHNVREVLRIIPDERLLLETDSPYLAPIPHRGKDNHPAYLPEIARKVASEKEQDLEQIAKLTFDNALRFFRIKA